MKITVIVAHEKNTSLDDSPPWIAGAWDEWTMDENYDGYEKDLARITRENPGCEIRVARVRVPDSFLNDVFKPIEVDAVGQAPSKIEPLHSKWNGQCVPECCHPDHKKS